METRPIAALVGEGVCRRAEDLRRTVDPQWNLVPDVDGDAGRIHDARAAIGMPAALDWRVATPRLELLQVPGAGLDGLEAARLPAGCMVCNVYEHEASVAEHVFACLLKLEGGWLAEAAAKFRAGEWRYSDRVGEGPRPSLCGRRFGIIGFGRIGRRCAAAARAFNMEVLVFTRRPDRDAEPHGGAVRFVGSVDEVLAASDYVLVACPLTPATRGLLGRQRLARLRPEAVLINIARAEVVEEQALFDTLAQRRIRGAVLDVWYQYPQGPPEQATGSRLPFHELENVICTPHLSANTEDTMRCRWAFIGANLNRLLRGEPVLNRVAAGEPNTLVTRTA
jgi:phosphoglycerate dehydrogenase-like enzyme